MIYDREHTARLETAVSNYAPFDRRVDASLAPTPPAVSNGAETSDVCGSNAFTIRRSE